MNKNNQGFTLIELLVAVLVMGTVVAIASPSWSALLNKQRLNAATEKMYLYLQDGKNKAQQQNKAYRVSFRNNNGVPQVAVNLERYADSNNVWENLSEESVGLTFILTDGDSITFNYDGTINESSNIGVGDSINVNMINQDPASQRCIVVNTLLGSLRKAEGENCDPP